MAKNDKTGFAYGEVTRLMKENLSDDKILRNNVKEGMREFLYEILKNICSELDEEPYMTIEYSMFQKAIKPYLEIEDLKTKEKEYIQRLDIISSNVSNMKNDLLKNLGEI